MPNLAMYSPENFKIKIFFINGVTQFTSEYVNVNCDLVPQTGSTGVSARI